MLRRARADELLAEGKRVIDRQMALAGNEQRKGSYHQQIQKDTQTSEETWRKRYADEVLAAWHLEDERSLIQRDGKVLHPGKYQRLSEPVGRSIADLTRAGARRAELERASPIRGSAGVPDGREPE